MEASGAEITAPKHHHALRTERTAPRRVRNILPIHMLVEVMAKPRPKPKEKKRSSICASPRTKPIAKALMTRSRYPRSALLKKCEPTRRAPRADPQNWAAKRNPARR